MATRLYGSVGSPTLRGGSGTSIYNTTGVPYTSGVFNVKTGGSYSLGIAGTNYWTLGSGGLSFLADTTVSGSVSSINRVASGELTYNVPTSRAHNFAVAGTTYFQWTVNGMYFQVDSGTFGSSSTGIYRTSGGGMAVKANSGDVYLQCGNTVYLQVASTLATVSSTNGIYLNSSTGAPTAANRQITGSSAGITFNVPSGLKWSWFIGGSAFGFMGNASGGGGTQFCFGTSSGANISTSNNIIAIGDNTLSAGASTAGSEQFAIGSGALRVAQATSGNNIVIGVNAANASTTLSGNVIIGMSAWQTGVGTGTNNTILGNASYFNATSGGSNTVIGKAAWGAGVATGSQNFIGGVQAAYNCTTISNSVVIGYQAHGSAVGTATGSVYIGYRAGYAVTSGARNVMVGYDLSAVTTGSSNILIGDAVTVGSNTSDWQINIGNAYRRDSAGAVSLYHGSTSYTTIYTTSSAGLTLGTAIALNFGSTGTVTAANRQIAGTSLGVAYNSPTGTSHLLSINNNYIASFGIAGWLFPNTHSGSALYYGFWREASPDRLNYNAPTGGYHNFSVNGVSYATINNSSLQISTANGFVLTGTQASLSGTYTSIYKSSGLKYNVATGESHVFTVNDSTMASLSSTAFTLGTSIKFIITTSQTPASAAATGTAGTIAWDTDYVYVCTATNTWKRAAIATW